ncbi:MAG: ATP synthase F0 subunit B [Deltaproteobacteria bacterium]|nr:ATP synthase F0 subunit B [Deltaproteobacteria bacterium]
MLTLDITLLYQMIGFVILLPILNRLLYKPVLKLLAERDEKTVGALKKASDMDKEVADGVAAYEKKLKEAAIKGAEEKNRLRQEARACEKDMLDKARATAEKEAARLKTELEKNVASIRVSVKDEAHRLSRSIASKMLDRNIAVMLALFALTLAPALVMASTGGEGAAHKADSGMLWKVINFAILVVGIVIIWKKVIGKLLNKRSVDIEEALKSAEEAKKTAEIRAAEYRDKLGELEKNVSDVLKELEIEGASERARIIKEAEAAATRLMEQARATAAQEIKKAKIELRREATEIASKLAEEILKKELTPTDQQRLVKDNIEKLRLN